MWRSSCRQPLQPPRAPSRPLRRRKSRPALQPDRRDDIGRHVGHCPRKHRGILPGRRQCARKVSQRPGGRAIHRLQSARGAVQLLVPGWRASQHLQALRAGAVGGRMHRELASRLHRVCEHCRSHARPRLRDLRRLYVCYRPRTVVG